MAEGKTRGFYGVQVTPTQSHTYSTFERGIIWHGNVCSGYITLTNGSGATLVGGTEVLVTGLPKPYDGGSVQIVGIYNSGNYTGQAIRGRINSSGQLQLWYGGSIENGVAVTFPFTYICNN